MHKFQNRIIIDPNFFLSVEELSKKNIDLSSNFEKFPLISAEFLNEGNLYFNNIVAENLFVEKGQKITSDYIIGAYDESINKYNGLAGNAYLISHTYIYIGKKDYIPAIYLSFFFFSRSKELAVKNTNLIYSNDLESEARKVIHDQMLEFLKENSIKNSILLIDGPIFTGSLTTKTIDFNEYMVEKNILPIYIVKNSISNLVCDNVFSLKHKYNSDMHWAYKFLKPGQRSNFFIYEEKKSKRRAKAFCYLKTFDISPVRIEVYKDIYLGKQELVEDLMHLIYFLIIAQGEKQNPQPRPIIIAESFSRESIKLFNLNKLMRKIGIEGIMNQNRNMVNF